MEIEGLIAQSRRWAKPLPKPAASNQTTVMAGRCERIRVVEGWWTRAGTGHPMINDRDMRIPWLAAQRWMAGTRSPTNGFPKLQWQGGRAPTGHDGVGGI